MVEGETCLITSNGDFSCRCPNCAKCVIHNVLLPSFIDLHLDRDSLVNLMEVGGGWRWNMFNNTYNGDFSCISPDDASIARHISVIHYVWRPTIINLHQNRDSLVNLMEVGGGWRWNMFNNTYNVDFSWWCLNCAKYKFFPQYFTSHHHQTPQRDLDSLMNLIEVGGGLRWNIFL